LDPSAAAENHNRRKLVYYKGSPAMRDVVEFSRELASKA